MFDDNNEENTNYKSSIRINKRISMLGVNSRRNADKLILAGKVKINNKVVEDLGLKINASDKIEIDGKKIDNNQNNHLRVFLMNKPKGFITTTSDPQGRRTIFDLVPKRFGKLIAVGRLDCNTEGLLILTNNGEYARQMELPQNKMKRVYRVRVFGKIDMNKLRTVRNPTFINGIKYDRCFIDPEKISDTYSWLRVTIFEGKNREVRKIMEYFHLRVMRLIRTTYGPYKLINIPEGCIAECRFPYKFDF